MNRMRRLLPITALVATFAIGACACEADEERAVTVSSPDSLTVTDGDDARKVGAIARLTETDVARSSFDFVFNTIEGASAGEGIALSVSGAGRTPNELVSLVLVLPVALEEGDEYTLGSTFSIQPGVSADPRMWGAQELQQAGRAEAAFSIATYTFPPPLYTADFVAASSTGTIRVVRRERGWVQLVLDLTFTDAAGEVRTVTGQVQANSERYTPPCT